MEDFGLFKIKKKLIKPHRYVDSASFTIKVNHYLFFYIYFFKQGPRGCFFIIQ